MFNLINPSRIFHLIQILINFINSIFYILLISALTFALILSPPDYFQGDSVRFMYVYVRCMYVYVCVVYVCVCECKMCVCVCLCRCVCMYLSVFVRSYTWLCVQCRWDCGDRARPPCSGTALLVWERPPFPPGWTWSRAGRRGGGRGSRANGLRGSKQQFSRHPRSDHRQPCRRLDRRQR